MKRVLWMVVFTAAVTSTAFAGKNAGGALIVHTNDAVVGYRDRCTTDYDDPVTCENAGTRTDRDGYAGEASIIWFIAAFPQESSPGVSAIDFGTNPSDFPPEWIIWAPCGPEGTVEEPIGNWPYDGEWVGNSIRFGQPILGNLLFPFYWFACWGNEGDYFGSGVHRSLGYAAFYDDGFPPLLDGITSFGQVRWVDNGGFNDCPVPPGELVACCMSDGNCVLFEEEACQQLGGESQGPGSVCDPNPCTQPPTGACCVGEDCHIVDAYDCLYMQGEYLGDGIPCNPNPCPHARACCMPSGICYVLDPAQCETVGGVSQPPETGCDPNPCGTTDIEDSHMLPTTWGRVKTEYR